MHAWALAPASRLGGGIDTALSPFGETGTPAVCLTVPRDEARDFAQSVLRAAGDGAERTGRSQVKGLR